jgi:hypothetical protein
MDIMLARRPDPDTKRITTFRNFVHKLKDNKELVIQYTRRIGDLNNRPPPRPEDPPLPPPLPPPSKIRLPPELWMHVFELGQYAQAFNSDSAVAVLGLVYSHRSYMDDHARVLATISLRLLTPPKPIEKEKKTKNSTSLPPPSSRPIPENPFWGLPL